MGRSHFRDDLEGGGRDDDVEFASLSIRIPKTFLFQQNPGSFLGHFKLGLMYFYKLEKIVVSNNFDFLNKVLLLTLK